MIKIIVPLKLKKLNIEGLCSQDQIQYLFINYLLK